MAKNSFERNYLIELALRSAKVVEKDVESMFDDDYDNSLSGGFSKLSDLKLVKLSPREKIVVRFHFSGMLDERDVVFNRTYANYIVVIY